MTLLSVPKLQSCAVCTNFNCVQYKSAATEHMQ